MESDSQSIKTSACPSCGEGNEKGNQFCVYCGGSLPRRRETRFKKRYILFGAIGLILVGVTIFFWIGGFEPKLVGRVNGEGITRKEFSKRVERAKKFYELRYGQKLFQGEEGKVLDEIRPGYKLNNRVLRCAQVRVGKEKGVINE